MLFSSEINVQEPVPGWVDNLNGPTGLFLIAGIGVMRTAVILEEVLHFFGPHDSCNTRNSEKWIKNVKLLLLFIQQIPLVDERGQRPCGHVCQPHSRCSLGDSQEPLQRGERYQGENFVDFHQILNILFLQVFNHISSNTVPLKWGEIYDTAKVYLMKNPLEGMVWFPGGSFKQSLVINRWELPLPVKFLNLKV